MSHLPEIASLWIGGKLSFLEQLCLKSFADAGHKTTLYVYEEVEGVPPSIVLKDARELYRGEPYHVHLKHQTPAIHADYFRLKLMLRGRGEIWVDTDAYCYKPFAFEDAHVYAWLGENVANGVMRLPPDSPALQAYEAFLHDPLAVPPFYPAQFQNMIRMMRENMFMIPLEAMPWGTTGPMALTYFLKQSREIEKALPDHVFYPAGWQERRKFLRPTEKYLKVVKDDTVSFHFYGRVVRRILSEEHNGLPAKHSILEELCEKHDIDSKAAPIEYEKPELAEFGLGGFRDQS